MNSKVKIIFNKNLYDIIIILIIVFFLPRLAESVLGIQSRYIINFDFLLILLLSPRRLIIFPIFYGLYLQFYLLSLIYESHYFFNIVELIYSVKELASYQKTKIISILICIPAVVYLVWILNKYTIENNRNLKYKIVYICLFLMVLDSANGSNRLNLQMAYKYNSNIFSSAVVRLVDQQLHRNNSHTEFSNDYIESATSKYKAWDSTDKNIVLIIVESMSTFNDDKVFKNLYEDLLRNNNKFQITKGFIPKGYGSTPGAEYRELCQTKASHLYNDNVDYLSCLPNILKFNYEPNSFHGSSKYVFNRNINYKKMGFTESAFLEQLSNLDKCDGSFPGVCDLSLIMTIQKILKESETPKFIYFLTLSSHLPVSRMLTTSESNLCSNLSIAAEACPFFFRLKDVINGIDRLLNTDTALKTDFIIVGDHPAPLLNSATSKMIDTNNVPYFIFQNNK